MKCAMCRNRYYSTVKPLKTLSTMLLGKIMRFNSLILLQRAFRSQSSSAFSKRLIHNSLTIEVSLAIEQEIDFAKILLRTTKWWRFIFNVGLTSDGEDNVINALMLLSSPPCTFTFDGNIALQHREIDIIACKSCSLGERNVNFRVGPQRLRFTYPSVRNKDHWIPVRHNGAR